jgi:pre-60S factor REI1
MASQVPTQANIQSTHPFTCNTCQVAFRSSELQRAHMQTDWHRYNLKRRVASLPPLSSEIFTEKVLANKATAAATAAKASFEKSCAICQKTYFSENAHNNHLNSQKHRTNVMKSGRGAMLDDAASVSGSMTSSAFSLGESMAESDVTVNGEVEKEFSEVVDGIKNASLDAEPPVSRRPSRPHHSSAEMRPEHPLSPTDTNESMAEDDQSSVAASSKAPSDPLLDCLFCNYKSPTFALNVNHMGRFHGMFVPEKDFLSEPENLIKYLHDKIHTNHECLKCHKVLHTPSGIQTHMRDRGHCMIGFEEDAELVEIGQFYDFRSSYPDAAQFQDMEDDEDTDDSASTQGGGVKLGAKRDTVTTTEDNAAMSTSPEDDAGWETDSTVSSVPTDEIGAVPIDRTHRLKSLNKSKHHNHADPRPHRTADGFHSHAHGTPHAVYHDDYELHLPSGRTAGHRSLNKYYRQNLRNYPGVAERMENAQRRLTAGSSGDDSDVDMDGEDGEQRQGRGRQGQQLTRANGGMGMLGVSETKKAEVRAAEKREIRRGERAKNRYQAGNEKRGNFQKHFRDPLLQ